MKYTRVMVFIILVFMAVSLVMGQEQIAPGDVVEGTANGEEVLYSFTATSGMVYLISLESDEFDPLVEVRTSEGDEIAFDDDSGGSLNALLSFTAPEDGDYVIAVTAWSASPAGSYTLSLAELELTMLTLDETYTAEISGSDTVFLGFEGTEGDFVTITGNSADDALDTELSLYNPLGEEIAFDDDGGVSLEPALVSVRLPATGLYQVRLSPGISGTELVGTVDVLVASVEAQMIDQGEVTLTLGEVFDYDTVYFTAEAGTEYRVFVSSTDEFGAPSVTINDGMFGKRLNADGFSSVSAVFTAETDGIVSVRVERFFSFEPADVTIAITEAE